MNVLLKLEGVVHQSKCIQWEKKRYELLVNADKDNLDEEMLVGLYRRYLGEDAQIDVTYVDEIPVQASGKRMVCENRCPDYVK
jgi:phenylacetate-CoA ligase